MILWLILEFDLNHKKIKEMVQEVDWSSKNQCKILSEQQSKRAKKWTAKIKRQIDGNVIKDGIFKF